MKGASTRASHWLFIELALTKASINEYHVHVYIRNYVKI